MMPSLPDLFAELRLYWACILPMVFKPTPLVREQAVNWLGWLPKQCHTRSALGFTLAELLIALAILSIIATFTIPKILTGSQNGQKMAAAKEVAAMISGAYRQAQLAGVATSTTKPSDLTPYMNYLAIDTSSTMDGHPTNSTKTCSASNICLRMQNGGMIWFDSVSFGGTSNLNSVNIMFDPDGTNNNNNQAVAFTLYYDGYITSRAYEKSGSMTSFGGPYGPCACDPSWFSW
jgi:prepilin-type N-terminal cleavage/methylation domain-containing protein